MNALIHYSQEHILHYFIILQFFFSNFVFVVNLLLISYNINHLVRLLVLLECSLLSLTPCFQSLHIHSHYCLLVQEPVSLFFFWSNIPFLGEDLCSWSTVASWLLTIPVLGLGQAASPSSFGVYQCMLLFAGCLFNSF